MSEVVKFVVFKFSSVEHCVIVQNHCLACTLPDYPSNTQFQAHFKDFLIGGYKSHFDAVVCKFPFSDGSRSIPPHTVGIVDGQAKILLMCAIVCFAKEILSPEQILQDETLQATLKSFRSIRCCYIHCESPSHFYLQSLRLLCCIKMSLICVILFCVN